MLIKEKWIHENIKIILRKVRHKFVGLQKIYIDISMDISPLRWAPELKKGSFQII